jgi:hypothetical protein
MKEFDFFTERRRWQLTGWDERMPEVERWKNYCYTPLDIPRIGKLSLLIPLSLSSLTKYSTSPLFNIQVDESCSADIPIIFIIPHFIEAVYPHAQEDRKDKLNSKMQLNIYFSNTIIA